MVVAFCGGALSGCGGGTTTTTTTQAPTTKAPTTTIKEPEATTTTTTKEPTLLEKAWKNHFDGFGDGVKSKKDTPEREAALTKIMADYDAKSTVTIWDFSLDDASQCKDGQTAPCDVNDRHMGLEPIKAMFATLFDALEGCVGDDSEMGLKAKDELTEATGTAPGTVFLVWQCKKKDFFMATDTFVFDGVKIRRQNIVKQSKATPTSLDSLWELESLRLLPQEDPAYDPKSVEDVFGHHMNAFGAGANTPADGDLTKALDDIMVDYTADSIIHVAEVTKDSTAIPTLASHKGEEIRVFFKGLFETFTNACNMGMAYTETSGSSGDDAKQIFLVWRMHSSGYEYATDTLVLDDTWKIIKQTLVTVRGVEDATGGTCPAKEMVV